MGTFPRGGGVAEGDGGGTFSAFAALAELAKTPPTDRCAVASPKGGGSLAYDPTTPFIVRA